MCTTITKIKKCVIREDLLAITGNCVEAAILNQFIYWSERIKDADLFIKKENEIAERNGEEEKEPFYGWMYKTNQEMADEILMGYSAVQTGRYINNLVDKGFIQKRHNPKYKWDRTLQYKVNLVNIARALKKEKYSLSDYKIELPDNEDESKDSGMSNDNSESNINNSDVNIDYSLVNDGNYRDESAIPYITSKTTITEINNSDTTSSDYNEINKYAFSEEKEYAYSEKIEENKEEYLVTEDKLQYEIFPMIDDYVEENYENQYENGMHFVLEDIIREFHHQYFMKYAKHHRIMKFESYKRVVDSYFVPPDEMEDVYDYESYKSMIECYFKTNYNRHGNYDGKINLSLAHFFSSNILKNLYQRMQC